MATATSRLIYTTLDSTEPISQKLAVLLAQGTATLGEREMRALLPALSFGPAIECEDERSVGDAVAQIGTPVVLKGLHPDALHKSEHGLVRTGLHTIADAQAAARELLDRLRSIGDPKKGILSVQAQLKGIEFAVGARRDMLGAICVVAAGGTMIELVQDRAVALVPVDRAEARALLGQLRIAPVLDGFRGYEPLNTEALVDTIVAVSELVAANPEIAELDLNPVFVSPQGCTIADARAVLQSDSARSAARGPNPEVIAQLFSASSLAIIGASNDPLKVGGLVLRYLRERGWPGRIVAISRSTIKAAGVESYHRLSEVPGDIDLACIALPATAVPQAIDDCIAHQIATGIIFSAGFSESGVAGKALEREVTAQARGRFRFVGPNTIGVAAPPQSLFATFGMGLESRQISSGSVAFISQSGAIASSLISRGAEFGLGFSRWASVGNEADLGVEDFIAYLANDPETSVICLFLETIRRPQAFLEAAEAAWRAGKPIVALKTGSSEAGALAALSHTGAITGASATYDAFLSRARVHQVPSLQALWSAARGLQTFGRVLGTRAGIMSMSGGACSLLADACSAAGLTVPHLSEAGQSQLREVIPSFGGVGNPIDVTAAGITAPDMVARSLQILRRSGDVDFVLLQLSTNADPAAERMAHDLVALLDEPGVPFAVGRLGSPDLAPRALSVYRNHGMHVFSWPEQLVEAARAAAHFATSVNPQLLNERIHTVMTTADPATPPVLTATAEDCATPEMF